MTTPLNLVSLERVSKAHGTTVLLDDVSLGIAAGERIGVVGRNGGGKSTLLSVLTGLEPPDSGRVTMRGGTALGVLDQSGTLPEGTTVHDVVLAGFDAEHEWAADAAVRSVLTGLELDRLGLDAPVAPMSGGERRRVALAAQLVRPLDLLVLDEPTNHLDVEGVAWLAEYVKARSGGMVVVTHDRWFLDEVCTTTWEVADGRSTPTTAGTPPTRWPGPSAPGSPASPRSAGSTWSARSWPGCAVARRPGPASPSSGSRPPRR